MAGIEPKSDPTALTTRQLHREVETLKEAIDVAMGHKRRSIDRVENTQIRIPVEIDKAIDHLRGFIETRLDAMDKATALQQAILDRAPQVIEEKINALERLHEEKFQSIQTQFKERDTRTEQSSKDSKVAVDAALQAAKEAVGEQNKSSALAISKSEVSTIKQIDQIGSLLTAQVKNSDDKFSDLKDRLTLIEGRGSGVRDILGWIIGGIGLVATVVMAVVMVLHK